MAANLAALDAHMGYIREGISELKAATKDVDAKIVHVDQKLSALDQKVGASDLAKGSVMQQLGVLEERVSHLPTKSWVGMTIMGLLAGIAALILFQGQVQAYLGTTLTP